MLPPHSPTKPGKDRIDFICWIDKELSVLDLLARIPRKYMLSDVKIKPSGSDDPEICISVTVPNPLYEQELAAYEIAYKKYVKHYLEEWMPQYKKWFKETNGVDI